MAGTLTADKFNSIKDRARALINMDANGSLNQIAENARSNGKMEYGDNIDYGQSYQPQYTTPQMQQPLMESSNIPSSSKLPKEILESFKTNPIDVSPLGVTEGTSILDQIGVPKPAPVQRKQVIRETVQQPMVETQNSSIDYSLIKTIVEEAVRKYSASIAKKVLNESKGNMTNIRAMKIGNGNKMSFISENGDIYEATLKFVKNIKDK